MCYGISLTFSSLSIRYIFHGDLVEGIKWWMLSLCKRYLVFTFVFIGSFFDDEFYLKFPKLSVSELIKRQSCHHIRYSQLTGFYMTATLTFNELRYYLLTSCDVIFSLSFKVALVKAQSINPQSLTLNYWLFIMVQIRW